MRKIVRLDYLNIVSLFAAFNAAVGLYAVSKSVIDGATKAICPLGLAYPLLTFTINLNLDLSQHDLWLISADIIIAVIFYALSGAISGAVLVFVYNLTARFWAGLVGEVEESKPSPEAQPGIGLI